MEADGDTIEFPCPRCRTGSQARFYGPCARCRDELVEAFRGRARDLEAARYEPVMHVVPNQVATKE